MLTGDLVGSLIFSIQNDEIFIIIHLFSDIFGVWNGTKYIINWF